MTKPISPTPDEFASEKEREFWHDAQDIAFRAGKMLLLRDGATWLVSQKEEKLVCRPQRDDSVWWETYMVLKSWFPELDRLWVKGRALTKPGEMNQRERRFPREAERALNQHPSVLASAVLGIGEECVAFIELRPGAKFDAFALMDYCQRKIDRFKTPKQIRVVDHLPRDSDGKIDYEAVRAMI